ncbi:MAG: ATP-binding protein [Bacteroidales bacterium]|nr:ATP-binding protein [Bacteroidales bacterium]
MFDRKLYKKMLEWKDTQKGKTALLVEGARRVGKSTLVKEFAKKEYQSHIFIDFSRTSDEIFHLFDNMSNLDDFFFRLKIATKTTLHERKSVIIFDEVQKQPLARQAIKHLVADGRYDYIETGSLISIKKNVQDIIIPSEEEKITLMPLDYEEFCWALGDNVTINLLRETYSPTLKLGETHRKLMRDFRRYIIIGGMPQAVAEYLKTNDLRAVDKVKRNILSLYEDDFRKIDPSGRISRLFNAIPAQLAKNASRYQPYSVVERSVSGANIDEWVSELESSKTVSIAYHADDPNVGFALNKDFYKYKLFLADTGLFVTLAFKDKNYLENEIYQKMLSDKLSANLGYVYENVIAQILKANGHELYYYTFPNETSNRLHEIDFLLSKKGKIIPIEVKSSNYKTHKSIDLFCQKFSSRIADRYIIHTKDFGHDGMLKQIPAYASTLL